MTVQQFVVAASRPWLRSVFDERLAILDGDWRYVSDPTELTFQSLMEANPRYVFFLHWSWTVPPAITGAFECVNFHMTDVPYGRGGSPLQNLIERGHDATVVTALKMVSELDAGPVYLRRPMPLHGSAEEIYVRAAELSASMIAEIVTTEPTPTAQEGDVAVFTRRSPRASELQDPDSLRSIYDMIRMLDAEGYPHAFLRLGDYRLEFRRAVRYANSIIADVTITHDRSEGP